MSSNDQARTSRRVLLGCSVALIVLGIPGLIWADSSLQRTAQVIAIASGVAGLLAVLVLLPWVHRRAERNH